MVKDLKQKYLKETVRAGISFGTFDSEVIAANGLDVATTMVIITSYHGLCKSNSNLTAGSVTNKTLRVLELHV